MAPSTRPAWIRKRLVEIKITRVLRGFEMAVVNTNSTNVAAALAAGAERVFPATSSTTSTDRSKRPTAIPSDRRIVSPPSVELRAHQLELAWDALGGSCAADVGIYEMGASGAVVDADEFASGVSWSTPGHGRASWRNRSRRHRQDGSTLWQRLDLTAPAVPGKSYDIVATTAASAAAGTVAMILTGYYAN